MASSPTCRFCVVWRRLVCRSSCRRAWRRWRRWTPLWRRSRRRAALAHASPSFTVRLSTPRPPHDVNLRAMVTMRDALGVAVGYSDHTQGSAVRDRGRGARGKRHRETPDARPRAPGTRPPCFAGTRRLRRDGTRHARRSKPPSATASSSRRRESSRTPSPRAKASSLRDAIAAGERLSAENLAVKRPGTGMSPLLWDDVVGRDRITRLRRRRPHRGAPADESHDQDRHPHGNARRVRPVPAAARPARQRQPGPLHIAHRHRHAPRGALRPDGEGDRE